MDYYKEKPTNKAEHHKFGIYSIKQREREKSLSTAAKAANLQLTITNNNCAASDISFGTLNDNSFGTATKIKDRVRNISQKVDTMKINDNTDAGPFARVESDGLHRDEKKKSTANRKKTLNHQYDDTDDSNKLCNEEKTKTQGDTLNEIKAMRRRHPRLVNTLYVNLFSFFSFYHPDFYIFSCVFFYLDQIAMIQRQYQVNIIHVRVHCHFDRKRRRQH